MYQISEPRVVVDCLHSYTHKHCLLLVYIDNIVLYCIVPFRLNGQWRSTKLCAELQEAISNGVNEHRVYAVRSSGTFEDGESTSSAGQYVTILGCTGRTCNIVDAVIECWSSNFSARALTYRKYVVQA